MTHNPVHFPPVPSMDDDMISLSEIAAILFRGKRWIIGATLVFLATALIYLFAVKPVYRSTALVKIEINQSLLIFSLLGAETDENIVPGINAAVEEMRSYDFIHNLMAVENPPGEGSSSKALDINSLETFKERITIAEKGKGSGLIEISVTGTERTANTLVLNNLIYLYGDQLGQRLTDFIDASLVLLEKRLVKNRNDIERLKADAALGRETAEFTHLTRMLVDIQHKINLLKDTRKLAANGLTVVSKPLSEDDPIRPKYTLVLVLAIMLGAMVGIVLVFVREMMRQGFRTAEEMEQKTGLKVLASIADRDPEGLRVLRTNLLYRLSQAGNNRVMFCSPTPAVESSTVISNLGLLLSAAGKKVLLVDGDLRQGKLHQSFGISGDYSLTRCLTDGDVATSQVNDNLHLIAGDRYPDNPSELLMGQGFANQLEEASTQYDVILVHVPPVLTTTDAAIVGAQCDTTILVAGAEKTTLKDLENSERRLLQAGVKITGCVFSEKA